MMQSSLEQTTENIGRIPSSNAESHTPNPSPKRRVGFLGTGYIADWHAQAIAKVSGVELVAVCDRILPKAQALAHKFGVPRAYDSLQAMLAEEPLDAVHVLLPPDKHFEAARTLLESGVNVLLEKPMCDHASDCESLARIAAERGLRIGVSHNFLFSQVYEQLRQDVRSGVLGLIDNVTITWHRPLPPTLFGPFNIWMLRDPRNIMLEIGSHSVSQMVDLVGEPEQMLVHPSNPMDLPTGRKFFRRWQVNAFKDRTAIELRFSFVPGFSEYTIHVRGSLASATVDFERSTYTRHEHRPVDPDFDAYAMIIRNANSLKTQARRTLFHYFRSKLDLGTRGNPYGATIVGAMDAFYAASGMPLDKRVDAWMGARVIRICEEIGSRANLPPSTYVTPSSTTPVRSAPAPSVLVLGATGFIGRELVRQLIGTGRSVRLLVRNPGNLHRHMIVPEVECQVGDVMDIASLRKAMDGVDCVIHLARSNVKTWAEYQEFEIGATRQIAQCALEARVKRFIYTGTIASYYQGARAGTITEDTPLDPQIARGNLYARAKTASEELLWKMHKEQGLPVVILRPGVVIGRGGSPFHWGVAMWWHDAVCQTWGDGQNKLPLVLVEDVASGMIAAMDTPDIEGRSFNLVGDPCLNAQEYLDELNRCGGFHVQRHTTPIFKFYLIDLVKWVAKVALRFPDRQFPHFRDWETRTMRATFDCTAAKTVLGWKPVTDRDEVVRKGIAEPLDEFTK
jgi:nucleoside-diphosphate-sugar epimerase/predicted dehydrogenase